MIRALIVDDEAPARDRLRRLLSTADVEIVGEAEDGLEAVSRIDALTPDLVFLDIQMPALSGLEVAARLQAPRPRIVFCTAYDRFAVDAFELHAVDYLLKPVNRDRLARTVERIAVQIAEQQRTTRERDEAVRTQMRLMPADTPGESGVECAGMCVPADGVGGDYYDFLPLGSGRLGIALGDVSGKGMYAGLLAAAVQARLQAITARGAGLRLGFGQARRSDRRQSWSRSRRFACRRDDRTEPADRRHDRGEPLCHRVLRRLRRRVLHADLRERRPPARHPSLG